MSANQERPWNLIPAQPVPKSLSGEGDKAITAADYALTRIGIENAKLLVLALSADWLTPREYETLKPLAVAAAYLSGVSYPQPEGKTIRELRALVDDDLQRWDTLGDQRSDRPRHRRQVCAAAPLLRLASRREGIGMNEQAMNLYDAMRDYLVEHGWHRIEAGEGYWWHKARTNDFTLGEAVQEQFATDGIDVRFEDGLRA